MNKAFVTLLIRSFRGGQATIAHYFYAISYYIIAVTGGGCFERTKISFIPFQGRIQRSAAITYPFEEQPNSTRQIQHILKVSRTTVYELLKSKKFYSVRVGGQYRISKKSFENWLNGEKGGSEDGIC